MDLKEYISSGIIESYVLGVVSDQEKKEVECMSHIYPEIQEQLVAAQSDLERLSESWAKPVPLDLKDKVMAAIQKEITSSTETQKEAKVISMTPSKDSSGSWKMIAAIAVVAFLVFGGLFFNSNSKLDETAQELVALKQENNSAENQLFALQSEIQKYDTEKNFLLDDNTVQVALSGTAVSPDSKMKIYWNSKEQKIVMAGTQLPTTAEELQYQLWAIVDGAPVDLGVFDLLNDKEIASRSIKVNNVQAFAVTLEKKGGSPTPNLEQLYVIGNV